MAPPRRTEGPIIHPMRGKILIVDDEPAIRQMVCLALAQANYDCFEAADAA